MVKTFRYRIYPDEAQQDRLASWDRALRFLWNLALEQRRTGYARPIDERVFLNEYDQQKQSTELRAALPWLANVPRNVSDQLLVELDKACQRCFKKLARMPRFKRKGRDSLSFCEPNPKYWWLRNDVLHFPKLGRVRTIVHRPIEGVPRTCTVVRDADQWFVCITCEIDCPVVAQRQGPVIGIDRGVVNVIADSDGKLVRNPRYYGAVLKQLARAQRTASRRKKGSKNRTKAVLRVARLHRKVRRQREHFAHQLSHDYSKSHATVVVEDLKIGNMVRANRGLSRSILDSGWGSLVRMLEYKLAWTGGTLGEVNPAYSSQTCSECGCIDAASRVSQSVFHCTACSYHDHADLNAAKVIKNRWKPSVQPAEASCRLRTRPRNRKSVLERSPAHTSQSLAL